MIFSELLNHFEIGEEFPPYLLDESFNEIFLDGDIVEKDGSYEIVITTRQNVTHQMFIRPGDEFPLIIMSELPNGLLNGMKFGQTKDDLVVIDKLE